MTAIDAMALRAGPAWRTAMMATLIAGAVGTMLAATIANVALPSIIGAFGLGQEEAQWLTSAFLVASTAAMLANTWAMAAFGPRAAFIGAMILFIAGCFVGASAQALPTLILGRVMQGAGAGLIQPMAMVLIFRFFPDQQRGLMIGLYSLGVILPPALGPVIGGYLTDIAGWRIVFAAASPLALLAIPLGAAFLPQRDDDTPAPRLDIAGLVLITLALALALQWLATGHREGWTSPPAALRGFGVAGTFIAFLAWERRCAFPILRLDLFAIPGFAAAAAAIFVIGVAVYGSTYLIPLFVQLVQHYAPIGAGQILLPAGVVMMAAFPLAGRLSDRIPPRQIALAGAVLFGVSMLAMSRVTAFTSFGALATLIAISRLSVGVVMPPVNAGAMRLVDPALVPYAAPAATFLTQSGGALGVGALAVLVQERAAFHMSALTSAASADVETTATSAMARSLRTTAITAGEAAHQAHLVLIGRYWSHAQLLAFRDAFLVLAVLFAGLVLLVLAIPGKRGNPRPIDQISSIPKGRS